MVLLDLEATLGESRVKTLGENVKNILGESLREIRGYAYERWFGS